MKYTETYSIEEENYVLVIEYEYYWDKGDYESPPEDEFTITEVLLRRKSIIMDITDFYWDWLDRTMHTQVYEYAREHAE